MSVSSVSAQHCRRTIDVQSYCTLTTNTILVSFSFFNGSVTNLGTNDVFVCQHAR